MAVIELFSRLLKTAPKEQVSAPAPDAPPPQLVQEPAPTTSMESTAFGVKFASRYAWQILPPAGWQRQESGLAGTWPASGTSPAVTFKAACELGKQAFIRWQLSGAPESKESHDCLRALISGFIPAAPATLANLSAPGLMPDMKIDRTQALSLEGGLKALLVMARYAQIKGEEPVLRYVLLIPDRAVQAKGTVLYFRETLQFVASQSEFSRHERAAVASLMTFRRTEPGTQQADLISASCQLP
jgi:hypothetical protein